MSPTRFPSLRLLGARVDRASLQEALACVESSQAEGRFLQIVTVNPLMLGASESDPDLRAVFARAELVVCDSAAVALVARLKGFSLPARIPGIDLMVRLCALAESRTWPVALVGARPGVAQAAARNLRQRFPRLDVAAAFHGYFRPEEEPALIAAVRERKARLLFAALDAPRQEKWIDSHRSELEGVCAMGVGGSLDVLSGRLRRAPPAVQRAGLEWFFRLIQEPWRWRRMAAIPSILVRALRRPI